MTSGATDAIEIEIGNLINKNDLKDLTIRDKDLGTTLQMIRNALMGKDATLLRNLKILRLERCKITSFEPGAGELPRELKHISLQGNRLKNIDSLHKCLGS